METAAISASSFEGVLSNVALINSVVGTPVPASSGTAGNFDVTYELTVTNTGTTDLDTLVLNNDIASQFGGAFVGIIPQSGAPAVITASTATDDPGIDAAFDGTAANVNIFDGTTSLLQANEFVTLQLVVEIDPDSPTAIFDGVSGDGTGGFENQANVWATDLGTVPSPPIDDGSSAPVFQSSGDLNVTFFNEQQFSFGFGLQNTTNQPIDDWAVQITNANYDLDESQFSNNAAFDLITTMNPDGTFNHLFVGTVTISPFGGIPGGNIALNGVNFGFNPMSDGLEVGIADTSGSSSGSGSGSGSGTGTPGPTVHDNSDDPADPSDNSDDADDDPDDPTEVILSDITLTKTLVGAPVPATSGVDGNFEVTYDLEFTNTGGQALNSLSLIEDLQSQYGGAFVGIVPQSGSPATVVSSSATDAPEINAAYDGTTANSQLIDNSGSNTNLLGISESAVIRIVIEIDPNNVTANLVDGALENQASVTGTGVNDGAMPSDLSDDPNDATDDDPNGDNNPDDPNLLRLPNISLIKSVVGAPVPASSGTAGNFEVTYELTVTNTGSTELDTLILNDDIASQFGGAFVGIVSQSGAPAIITASTAIDNPGISTAFDGTAANSNIFDGTTSLLQVNEFVTVQITVEIDPDSPTAIFDGVSGDGTGDFENQANIWATDPGHVPIAMTGGDDGASDLVFQPSGDLNVTFFNEQQFSFGFGLQNTTNQPIDDWAVQITNANYDLDESQFSNNAAFDLITTMNPDGTFNHLFVGTVTIPPFGGIPGGNIALNGVCLLYTSPSPRDLSTSRMPSSA